jgi:uncharacterized protein (DUF305 family)
VAALLAAALLLAACGDRKSSESDAGSIPWPPASASGSTPPQGFNAADVMFAQMMVPHHDQGIEIVRLADGRAIRPEVKTLAAAIESTQRAEAATMAGWLKAWGKPPTAPPDAHAAHGGMPGASPEGLTSLKKATGAAFDRAFLNMLIAHQDDAIQLARSETVGGANAEAKALAKRIDQSRTAQIAQMLAMLGG